MTNNLSLFLFGFLSVGQILLLRHSYLTVRHLQKMSVRLEIIRAKIEKAI